MSLFQLLIDFKVILVLLVKHVVDCLSFKCGLELKLLRFDVKLQYSNIMKTKKSSEEM